MSRRLIRDVVFLSLIVIGLASLAGTLWPPRQPPVEQFASREVVEDPQFQRSVALVNEQFRQEWKARGLEPAPVANDLLLARRLSLALMGTIPSLEEIRQYERSLAALQPATPSETRADVEPEPQPQPATSTSIPGGAAAWWVGKLLDNPRDQRYADYFAERLARAYVGTDNGAFLVFRRRRFVRWLAEQLQENRPYDDIVRSILTDEGVWTDTPSTNFITATVQGGSENNQPHPEVLAGRVSRTFLGVRLDCAECHNHPFEKWTQADFRGLAAYFGTTRTTFTGVRDVASEKYEIEDPATKTKQVIAPKVPFLEQFLPQDEGLSARQQLAGWLTHRKEDAHGLEYNPFFARATVNRVWSLMFGKALVEPVEDLSTAGQFPPVLELLAEDFARHKFDLKRLIRVIATSEVFQRESLDLTPEHEEAWATFPITRLRPEQVVGGLLQSASLQTIDQESHIVVQLAKFGGEQDFVERYGDLGDAELEDRGGTIPQRLLMMNGNLVDERIDPNPFNASTRIAWLAANDPNAVEAAYLAVLTRRPTAAEAAHFATRLQGKRGDGRSRQLEDLYWALLNSTEFSWNH